MSRKPTNQNIWTVGVDESIPPLAQLLTQYSDSAHPALIVPKTKCWPTSPPQEVSLTPDNTSNKRKPSKCISVHSKSTRVPDKNSTKTPVSTDTVSKSTHLLPPKLMCSPLPLLQSDDDSPISPCMENLPNQNLSSQPTLTPSAETGNRNQHDMVTSPSENVAVHLSKPQTTNSGTTPSSPKRLVSAQHPTGSSPTIITPASKMNQTKSQVPTIQQLRHSFRKAALNVVFSKPSAILRCSFR